MERGKFSSNPPYNSCRLEGTFKNKVPAGRDYHQRDHAILFEEDHANKGEFSKWEWKKKVVDIHYKTPKESLHQAKH